MFEVLFWDVVKSNEWSLGDREGHEVDTVALTKAMLNGLATGPSEKIDCADVEKAYADNRADAPAKEITPEPTVEQQQPQAVVAPPVVQAPQVAAPVAAAEPTAKVDPKKIKKMEFKGTKIEMPYLPSLVDYSKCCQGVKICGGLLSPCLTHVKEGGFCKPCQKLQDEGKADGTLADREAAPLGEFASKKSGKKEISFATYLQKRDITVEEFNAYLATEIGASFQIPNEPAYMSVDKKKAKKAKKTDKPKKAKKDGDASDEESVASKQSTEPVKEKVAQPPQEEQAAEDDVISPMSDMPEDLESKVTEESHDKESGITSFRFEGKYYIRDPENSVFALNDEGNPVEAAGSWDPISNTIMFKDGYNP
tara:strand:+ start:290 stop:1387 length:1098 start_codon:yes stop_codon:yes gene_type:complete